MFTEAEAFEVKTTTISEYRSYKTLPMPEDDLKTECTEIPG